MARLFIIVLVLSSALVAQGQTALASTTNALQALLKQFTSETSREAKELALLKITMNYPNSGPDLLILAACPEADDTKWLAIRGIGELKFKEAISLPLIDALAGEQDSGVIEQTDFGFPACTGHGPCGFSEAPIVNARDGGQFTNENGTNSGNRPRT